MNSQVTKPIMTYSQELNRGDSALSKEFRQPNFRLTSYTNAQGKLQPKVDMTLTGFSFLINKFGGKKAAEHD